jgi:hypothetical protein
LADIFANFDEEALADTATARALDFYQDISAR